jgi:hypothetical protein
MPRSFSPSTRAELENLSREMELTLEAVARLSEPVTDPLSRGAQYSNVGFQVQDLTRRLFTSAAVEGAES